MSEIQAIAETPTTLKAKIEHHNADGTAWYSDEKFHESLLRAWLILEYIQNLLEQGAPGEVALTIIKDLRGLPQAEVDGSKFK